MFSGMSSTKFLEVWWCQKIKASRKYQRLDETISTFTAKPDHDVNLGLFNRKPDAQLLPTPAKVVINNGHEGRSLLIGVFTGIHQWVSEYQLLV